MKKYTLELVQAINDWQKGGNRKQKTARGVELKRLAQCLPEKFRLTDDLCYRQIALSGKSVWIIGTKYFIGETVSSWTEDISVSKDFKGGVPPDGYQGIIFKINPQEGSVVVNLRRLFHNADFIKFIKENKSKIRDYHKGIGRYSNTQREVVIEVKNLSLDSIVCWGGYSSPEDKLALKFFQRKPTDEEMKEFRALMIKAGHKCGPYWLSSPEAIDRINKKLIETGRVLEKKKRRAGSTSPTEC